MAAYRASAQCAREIQGCCTAELMRLVAFTLCLLRRLDHVQAWGGDAPKAPAIEPTTPSLREWRLLAFCFERLLRHRIAREGPGAATTAAATAGEKAVALVADASRLSWWRKSPLHFGGIGEAASLDAKEDDQSCLSLWMQLEQPAGGSCDLPLRQTQNNLLLWKRACEKRMQRLHDAAARAPN